jgi:3-hydroxyacyl-CoA dehydrogenase
MALGAVRQDRHGDVLVLTLDYPPVNALSHAVRSGLAGGLDLAAADETLQAVVLTGTGAQFSAGADIAEMGAARASPDLPALCLRIENFSKPVVAALQGAALGGGLELALAAHYRIAAESAQVGLPEVRLGILPGAGGTQRLPRLIGAAQALRLILGGDRIAAVEALALGLLDQVVEDNLTEAALAAAVRLVQGAWQELRAGLRRDGMRDALVFQGAIRQARLALTGPLPAPARIVDCVEAAALLPYDQGLAFERVAFDDLIASPEAQALRHAFAVERRAAFPPSGLAAIAPAPLGHVAILGATALAAEVARTALAAGLRVTLIDPQRDPLVQAVEKIAAAQELAVAEGRLAAETRDADWARLSPSVTVGAAASADLILQAPEAVIAPPDGPPLVGLGGGVGDVVLIPSLQAGGLAELAARASADPAVQALALAFARRLGWRVVFTGAGGPVDRRLRATLAAVIARFEAQGLGRAAIAAALAGFGLGVPHRLGHPPSEARDVVPACLAALANQGARLLEEEVARRPGDIDAVAIAAGLLPRWQGGPMFQADRRGLMVLRADLRRRAEAAPALFTPAPLLDRLISEGRCFADMNRA